MKKLDGSKQMSGEWRIVKDFGDCSSFERRLNNFFNNDASGGGFAERNGDDSAWREWSGEAVGQNASIFTKEFGWYHLIEHNFIIADKRDGNVVFFTVFSYNGVKKSEEIC